MIKDNFYPTSNTYATLEVTSSITNLNLTDKDVDPCHAYYMGQLKSDDIRMFTPKKFEIEKNELDPGKSIIKLTETDTPVWWGYSYVGTGDTTQYLLNWDPISLKYQSSMRMINSAYSYYINSYGDIELRFRYYVFEQETVSATGLTRMAAQTTAAKTITFTMEQFIDMMENDTEITVTFTINNVDTDFTVKMSDFQGDGFLQVDTDTYIVIYGIDTKAFSYYFGDTTRRNIVPFISMSLGDKYFATNLLYFTGSEFDTRIQFDYSGSNMDVDNTKMIASYCGYLNDRRYMAVPDDILSIFSKPFSVTWDDLRSVINGTSSKHVLLGEPNNHVIFYSTSTDGSPRSVGLIRTFDPYNYYTILCLINKYRSSGTTGTGSNTGTYDKTLSYYSTVALFNTDNSPKSERASYDGDYPEFQKQLRDWQKYGYNIADDEFNPEGDVPPGPDDDWDPDTIPDEDDNDYERTPTTQLHLPFLGALGQRWWAMTSSEFNEIVSNVKSILTVWSLFAANNAQDISESPGFAAYAKSATDAYSSGFVSNPVDCVAAVLWYPFDITLMLDAVSQTFVWGGSTATVFNGVSESGTPDTSTRSCLEITGYLNNAYWLDGGFTDYFKHYKNFIDYHPYCTAELYVPYCGSVKIDPQQYVGHHLSVRYLIDFPTGACLALIYRDNLVVDTIAGQIGVSVAMSMPDYIEYSGRHMQAATNVKASKLQTLGTIWSTVGRALKGDIGAIGGATAIAAGFEADKLAEYQLDNTLINQKTISTASPAISTGNEQKCRLVLYQPRWLEGYGQNSYGRYGHTTGFATIENKTIGSFNGFTIAESIDTSGIAQATEKEKAMIQNAFKGGVYL